MDQYWRRDNGLIMAKRLLHHDPLLYDLRLRDLFDQFIGEVLNFI